VAVEGGVHWQVMPENLGLFLSEIRNNTECEAAVSVLLGKTRHTLKVEAYQALLKAISVEKEKNKAFPLTVTDKTINEKLVRAGCQLDEGKHWRWCVLRWEGARIYEYKVVVASDMKIGMAKQLLIDGPEGLDYGGSIVVEVLNAEERSRYEAWHKAMDFITKVLRPYMEQSQQSQGQSQGQ